MRATIFLSAFLLFLIQPIFAKMILPWFGGSAAVWTTCLVFFQVALLAGWLPTRVRDQLRSLRVWQPNGVVQQSMALLGGSLFTLLPVIPASALEADRRRQSGR